MQKLISKPFANKKNVVFEIYLNNQLNINNLFYMQNMILFANYYANNLN